MQLEDIRIRWDSGFQGLWRIECVTQDEAGEEVRRHVAHGHTLDTAARGLVDTGLAITQPEGGWDPQELVDALTELRAWSQSLMERWLEPAPE